ncbi:MAG: type II toxin-antitoxin system PemK/MazF family toxin, partial [Clostridia bacterium]|nr:type II toxin-antitoxin system PemK/MazF family toxin [Clostridia bacterium]
MNSNSKIHSLLSDTENILLSIDNSEAEEFAEWTNEKATLKFNTNLPKFHITNNYIYWCNLGNNIGSEQNKIRPVLVVKTSKNSPICTVLPLTTERLKDT